MKPVQAAPLDLESFLPYRLAVLAARVSTSLARVYAARFDLGIPEWRVLAILGRYPGSTARAIADRAAMDKVTVSRAVASLVRAGRLRRLANPDDRRSAHLEMTPAGRRVYEEIAPLALAYQERLLAALAPADREALERILNDLAAAIPGRAAADPVARRAASGTAVRRLRRPPPPAGGGSQIRPASGEDGSA